MTSKKCQFSSKRHNAGINNLLDEDGTPPTLVEPPPSIISSALPSVTTTPVSITASTTITPLISKLTPLNPLLPIAELKPDINACISSLKPVAPPQPQTTAHILSTGASTKIAEMLLPKTPTSISALLPQHPEPPQPPARPSSTASTMSSGSSSAASSVTSAPPQTLLTTNSALITNDNSSEVKQLGNGALSQPLPLPLPPLENSTQLMAAAAAAAGAMALRNPLFLSPLILTASVNQLLLQQRQLHDGESEDSEDGKSPLLPSNDEILRNVKNLIPQFPLLAPLLTTMAQNNPEFKKTPGIADSFAELYGETEVANIRQLLDTINVSVTKTLLEDNLKKWGKEFLSGSRILEQLAHAQPLPPAQIFSSNNRFAVEGYGSEDEEDEDKHIENSDKNLSTPFNIKGKNNGPVSSSRVRTLISDEQVMVLKGYYNNNSKPKREELQMIADEIGHPFKVIKVWFQNTRARDRREGRSGSNSNNKLGITGIPITLNQKHYPNTAFSSTDQTTTTMAEDVTNHDKDVSTNDNGIVRVLVATSPIQIMKPDISQLIHSNSDNTATTPAVQTDTHTHTHTCVYCNKRVCVSKHLELLPLMSLQRSLNFPYR